MTYLSRQQVSELGALLRTFFSLPYSTDLDGKDAETLIRIVKGASEVRSKRKELFDIVDRETGYSVKTLRKPPSAVRVDLQEQRFCDVSVVRKLASEADGTKNEELQGNLILEYMRNRITDQMKIRGITVARSIILLKYWNAARTEFSFRYWEEDFLGFIDDLYARNKKGEVEWIIQPAGIHARDRLRQDGAGKNVRLLRMHYKHNQIFTDHDIPSDAERINFQTRQRAWIEISSLLGME